MTTPQRSFGDFQQQLAEKGYCFRLGPIVVEVRSDIPLVAEGLWRFYADYPVADEDAYADFHVHLFQVGGLRRWFRPQVQFGMDGHHPFKPLPLVQAFPMFEWTLNWCVATYAHQFLIFHSAVVERDGVAAILAAPSGSGKSTLCAALVNRGWRLFTDELALVDLNDGQLVPFPRPVGLKNESIQIMRDYAPEAVIGPATHDTRKGTVTHMKAPAASIEQAADKVWPGWIVFPHYLRQADASIRQVKKAAAGLSLIENSFNYHVLGQAGFEALTSVLDRSQCFEFSYSSLDEAIDVFDRLEPPT